MEWHWKRAICRLKCEEEMKTNKQTKKQKTVHSMWYDEEFRFLIVLKICLTIDCEQSLRMVTRARNRAKRAKVKNKRPRGSCFPLGHFALSSPAELRLNWLKRDVSTVYFILSILRTDLWSQGNNNTVVANDEKFRNSVTFVHAYIRLFTEDRSTCTCITAHGANDELIV